MKKVMIRLCALAFIGLALAACHNNDKPADMAPTPVIDTVGANHPEEKEEHKEKEHTTPAEEPTHHHEHGENKETQPGEKGTPKVDTADVVKPKDESTMGGTPTKHHVKPGGIQGTK